MNVIDPIVSKGEQKESVCTVKQTFIRSTEAICTAYEHSKEDKKNLRKSKIFIFGIFGTMYCFCY